MRTPYLDRLAGDSINFTAAASTGPICTPYRGYLLTGRHPPASEARLIYLRVR